MNKFMDSVKPGLVLYLVILLVFGPLAGPLMAEDVPLGSTYTSKFVMTFDSSGNEAAAASTPTYAVYEESTAAAIITGSLTLLAGTTNVYYYQIAATSGNGFEAGKWYNTAVTATVGSGTSALTQNLPNDHFRVLGTENVSGYQVTDAAYGAGTAWNSGAIQANTIATDTITNAKIAAAAIGVSEAPNLDAAVSSRIAPTTAGRTLTVSAAGNASINWGDVQNPTTTLNLSGTTVGVTSSVSALTTAVYAGFFTTDSGKVFGDCVSGSVVCEITNNAGMTAATYALTSGTADSGTTTTMVDAARAEADTDYWKGDTICFTSGDINGQCRVIEAFTPASDTITFTPAVTQTVATQNYSIYQSYNGWDSILADHIASGSTGAALNTASAATDPWSVASAGYTTAGTFGNAVRRLPEIAAGAAGGLFIAGSNAATTVNLTGDITGNLSGSVGSVTGNLGGNVNGFVTSLGTDAMSAASVSSGAVTKIQTNLLTLQANTAFANFPVFMLDSDGNGVLSLTSLTCYYQLDGGAWGLIADPHGNGTSAPTERGRGLYTVDLTAAELNSTKAFNLECDPPSSGTQIFRFSATPQH